MVSLRASARGTGMRGVLMQNVIKDGSKPGFSAVRGMRELSGVLHFAASGEIAHEQGHYPHEVLQVDDRQGRLEQAQAPRVRAGHLGRSIHRS